MVCNRENSRRQRLRSGERICTQKQVWGTRNAERLKAYMAQYYQEHRQEIRERARSSYAAEYAAHPGKYLAKYHTRRAALRDNGGSYTLEEWEALCTECGNICLMCRKPKKLTVDHVVPISRGGRNDIGNIQPLCRSRNARKSDKIIDLRGSHQTPPTDSLQDPSNP